MARSKRYPGRDRVVSRDSARDYLYKQSIDVQADKYACQTPYIVHAIGLPSMLQPDKGKLPLEMPTRCRKCPNCLKHRRRLWTARALDEVRASGRTWFGTLTVRPMDRFKLGILAERKHLRCGGESLSSLIPSEQFQYLSKELHLEVTKWLKRVRAESRAPLRYLLVTEAHKDGFPHLHILLHEGAAPVQKLLLEKQWVLGYSHWRLVGGEGNEASYACKYLSKEALTRVRASLHYGQPHLVRIVTEALVRCADTLSDAVEAATTVKTGFSKRVVATHLKTKSKE